MEQNTKVKRGKRGKKRKKRRKKGFKKIKKGKKRFKRDKRKRQSLNTSHISGQIDGMLIDILLKKSHNKVNSIFFPVSFSTHFPYLLNPGKRNSSLNKEMFP